ncbi:unnamed protein product [Meganyctiphanes norvegica]|uniref:Ankyrin repeat domain-containing protein n=1 Tax=Meganyctiphanes norvegica TaxID=48144 RepID=A0AAV2S4I2_MEGNR
MGKMPHIMDLHQAIVGGDIGLVTKICQSGLDLGTPMRGTTALSLAVYRGNLEAVRVLLSNGAPLDRRSKDHLDRIETPIISAIRLGHEDIFNQLVAHGARLDVPDFYNQTPLWFAVKEQRLSFVRVLLQAGAPINFIRASENPLNLAVQFLGYRGRRELMIELIAAGLPLSLEDYKGQCPLYWAMKHADLEFFRLLIEAGAKVRRWEWLSPPNLPLNWQKQSEVMPWIAQEQTTPPPLTRLARTAVRQQLSHLTNRDIRSTIIQLPLPTPLIRNLLLNDPIAKVNMTLMQISSGNEQQIRQLN